jgi:hypothetical protein
MKKPTMERGHPRPAVHTPAPTLVSARFFDDWHRFGRAFNSGVFGSLIGLVAAIEMRVRDLETRKTERRRLADKDDPRGNPLHTTDSNKGHHTT